VCLILPLLLIGCGLSSPRFTSNIYDTTGRSVSPKYAKEIAEEERENDRWVEPEEDLSSIPPKIEESNPSIDRYRALNQIMSLMGTPYAYSGTDSNGLDCSGFTSLVYLKALGVNLPRSCTEQFGLGNDVGQSQLRFGDLVFFNTEGDSPSHVGIYVGDGLFAHASVSAGVTISVLESTYYRKRYAGARRIVH
jgi:cell wall-associated NlpC family hydrolase